MKSVTLESSKFIDLIRVLSIFKDLCNDIDINDGFIRQKTNDTRCVFEIDLTSYIKDLDIPITDFKKKLDLLKSFIGQDITIESNDTYFIFSDKYSSLKFKKPHKDFITKANKFMDIDTFNNSITIEDDMLILNASISKLITDRMRIVTQGFGANSVFVDFDNDTAAIYMNTVSKDQSASLASGLTVEKEDAHFKTPILVTPFIVDHDDDIIFKMYEDTNNRLMNYFSLVISDINISIYTRSPQVAEDEEENA